jgi:hypothetical protein
MITKEFIAELEKVRDLFDWTMMTGDSPYVERRKSPRLRVRAKIKNSADNVLLEPIGAVCFARIGILFSEHYWVEAALSIALSIEDARDIVAATNDMTWRTVGNARQPDPYKQALRECLLDITKPLAELNTVSR